MKYFFVISRYNDYRQAVFDDIISPRNKEFCEKHDYKYIVVDNDTKVEPFRGSLTWNKLSIVKDLLDKKVLKDGDTIVNMDSDQFIVDVTNDIPNTKSLAYAIDSCNSHCNSLLSFNINEWSRDYINTVLDEGLWNKWKDVKSHHEGFPGKYDSFFREFREQAMMYLLFGIKRHSNESFWNLPNFGWHSKKTEDCRYSLDELNEHVVVLPTEWNVTSFDGEHESYFFVNKVEKENVITRHFAGQQDWNLVKNWL